jgi:serine/threonine protein kinase
LAGITRCCRANFSSAQADAPRSPGTDVLEQTLSFLEPSTKPGSLGRLAHYEVLEVLGRGGFGTVVKAFDEKLERFIAIKLMSPLLAATSAPRKRLLREARAAAAVRHTNVIAIYSVEDLPIPYLVMEYVAGRTLQQKLDITGPLELHDVLRIGRQIAAGLATRQDPIDDAQVRGRTRRFWPLVIPWR